IPSQHASFSGTRTALAFQAAMACTDSMLAGPSKMPRFCTHWYSVPERFTPRSCTVSPAAFWIRLPTVCRPSSSGPTGVTSAGVRSEAIWLEDLSVGSDLEDDALG